MECIIIFLGMYCQDTLMNISPQLLGLGVQNLSIAYQQLAAKLNRQLEPLDLNMTQISLLTHLTRVEREETVLSLSQAMQMNQPMVSKAVQAMEARGWIDKTKSVADARVSFLKVTSEGQAHLQQAQHACVPVLQQVFGGLEKEELMQLIALLQKMNKAAWQ